jgi:HEAT repeat protein
VEAKAAIPALIAALKDKEGNVRSSAAEALGKMGVEAKAAIPALIAALKDENAFVRYRVAEALGKMGVEAKAAIPTDRSSQRQGAPSSQ